MPTPPNEGDRKARSDSTLRNLSAFGGFSVFRSCLQRDLFVSKSKKRSAINIRRSMLDVRCSTFNLFAVAARRSFIRGFSDSLS